MRRLALLLIALLGLLPLAAWGAAASAATGAISSASSASSASSDSAASAASADSASISYVEPTADGQLRVILSLPPDAEPDLGTVSVRVGGEPVAASAEPAGSSGAVRRTAVLAVDTSRSMAGEKFEASRTAALAFVDGLPDDVSLGIVTFAKSVDRPLALTQDRAAARAVIEDLSLSGQTALYDGILSAVEMTGTEGQRNLVVLSDGADTSDTTLEEVIAAVTASGVEVDVISLEQSPDADLAALAEAGDGEVVPASREALASVFAAEAQALDRQVLVTATIPDDLDGAQQTVEVSMSTSSGPIGAEAFAVVTESLPGSTGVDDLLARDSGSSLPSWVMYVGVLAVGIGLVALMVLLVPRPAAAPSVVDRVATYTARTGPGADQEAPRLDTETAITQARDAAAHVLQRSRGLEARIAARLDGAGSELKPAEWLLVHTAVVLAAGLVGLLLGTGNILVGLLFIAVGMVGPWVYLGIRGSRRRKAFDENLPDTLQLISGALTAGLSLAQAVDTVVREGQEPVRSEFKRVLVETRLGVELESALEGVAERFASKDFEWVVMAIRIQRQVGGNLAELLDTVAATMRERAYVKRQVAALAAEGKLSAIVLGALPPIFLLYLVLTNGDYVSVLFTDPRGIIMLVGGALWLGVGVFWMSRLVKVEV